MAEATKHTWRRPSLAAALLVATWVGSLAIVFVHSTFVPQTHSLPAEVQRDLKPIQDRLRDKGSLSARNMESLEDIAKRAEVSAKANLAREGFRGVNNRIGQQALWVSWVPWLLLAAWLRPSVGEILVIGAGVSGLLLFGILSGAEAIVYSSVVLLALVAKVMLSGRRPNAP